MTRKQLLLTAQDRFILTDRGVALAPALPIESMFHSKQGILFPVNLERPDGTIEQATIRVYLEHFNPGGFKLICYLQQTEIGKVPIGTKVWMIEDP